MEADGGFGMGMVSSDLFRDGIRVADACETIRQIIVYGRNDADVEAPDAEGQGETDVCGKGEMMVEIDVLVRFGIIPV